MYYEEVKLKPGDTLSALVAKYGYDVAKWESIWKNAKNAPIKATRGTPKSLRPNDIVYIPIPWKIVLKTLKKNVAGTMVTIDVKRDGKKGSQLRWVQTVDQGNQPIGATGKFCVDACPPDDADPFYWTSAELTADPKLRGKFSDTPSRRPPSKKAGTTKWRALLSIAVVTGKRVTVYGSLFWGFDLTPKGVISKIGPRPATATEITGHLSLLKKGKGTGGKFSTGGWTFRNPPAP